MLPDLLHAHFWDRVTAVPGDVALVEGNRTVTFAELGARVCGIVDALAEHDIGSGALVGLHMERSIDWVAATLAVLTTNAAVVPLPPSYPAARIREIVSFGELDVVIDTAAGSLEPMMSSKWLVLDQLLRDDAPPVRACDGSPSQAAFVLCSSGSTGRPKMIVRSHGSFFHRLRWTWIQHPYERGEHCCQKSHSTTTHAIYELFEPLLKGVPVTMIPDEVVRDLERFWAAVRQADISRLLVVPAQLQASLAMPGFVAPRLRVLVLMGEYVSPTLAAQVLNVFPESTAAYSIYGSTEASSILVCELRESFRSGKELPLGRPISNEITALVLDGRGRPVVIGEVGRLCIAGPAVFTEYFRDPKLTAAAFVDTTETDVHLYDTADDVRRTVDGQLEFVGRADHTVKIRGFRVDLREVEATLLSCPDVTSAAVVALDDAHGTKKLRAFATPASLDTRVVYQSLRETLPDYMLPSSLVTLDALPLTPSGKIDRLRLQDAQQPKYGASHQTHQWSQTEQAVAEIWAGILGDFELTAEASFFELGGTSLSAFLVVHRLREQFGLDAQGLDVETIYRRPTIAQLAVHIEQARGGVRISQDATNPILVTLRKGREASAAPVFFIAPAGGTLGSYGKLTRLLKTNRELIGIRDPFNWGDRDPSRGFDHWLELYTQAITEHQPVGPYFIVAYSSGAPFGYEIARRLRDRRHEVGLLALIDPLGLDRRGRSRYGWWVIKASGKGPLFRSMVRMVGWLRLKPLSQVSWLWPVLSRNAGSAPRWDPKDAMQEVLRDRYYILSLSALLELNSGMRYALDPEDLDRTTPDQYLSVLKERFDALSPEVDFEAVKQVIRQYPLQVREQEYYQLRPYEGDVLLFEADAPHAGLVRAQLRPYVRRLDRKIIALGEPSERVSQIAPRWGPAALHFRSMRDEQFVACLANELDRYL